MTNGTSSRNPLSLVFLALLALGTGALAWNFVFAPKRAGRGNLPFERHAVSELKIKGTEPDGALSWSSIEVPAAPSGEAALARGRELFGQACVGCHGATGKGDGPLAQTFDLGSAPANLTQPTKAVKIRSTLLGDRPRGEDLFRTLTRGLPGTQMWSYRELPPEDRWALVRYVQALSDSTSEPAAAVIPQPLPNTPELRAFGKTVYQGTCLACHGPDGMGGPTPVVDSESGRPYPGVKFAREGGRWTLGGSSEADLARTIYCGFHTLSPMRSFRLYFYGAEKPSPAQQTEGDRKLWGVVYYVRELMEKSAQPAPTSR